MSRIGTNENLNPLNLVWVLKAFAVKELIRENSWLKLLLLIFYFFKNLSRIFPKIPLTKAVLVSTGLSFL
jgi:hypothetical protein